MFVNADMVLGHKGIMLDHNLFSYCRQNPVTGNDPSGMYDPDERAEKERQRKAERQILNVVRKNCKDRIIMGLFGYQFGTQMTILFTMYREGQQHSVVDYKDLQRWAKTFPGLPFPGNKGEDKIYLVKGVIMSTSDIGNFNFGAMARAYREPLDFVLWQAGAAQLRKPVDEGGRGLSFIDSEIQSRDMLYYGDDQDDYENTTLGYRWWDSQMQ